MIGYLRGTLFEIVGQEALIISEGTGTGYLVSVGGDIFGQTLGSELAIYIYHHITEQGQRLFGFRTLAERDIFVTLLSVNGLGPKGALALLGLGDKNLVQAIAQADEGALTSAPGVGPKLAKKIILELSGKLTLSHDEQGVHITPTADNKEIVTTLVGMGYDKKSVEKVLASMPSDIVSIQEKTLYCIRNLSHSI